ncbi:hypothetical protein [Hymenobacter siberiensis]|uniref:hypothetical protein n=1 Tax=Hymenobacter siberiensis TaxID=2848396 RepID=UPI001C1DEF84|nr:hypothetical protein [Hymenobacter siberiensis]MBU6119371.1 hypothetical protein [Hymenobacter siberiensis]
MTHPSSLSVRLRPVLAFAALAFLVVGIEHTVVRLPSFPQHPALSWAVLFDVLVGLPLLFYVLLLRRYRLSPLVLGGVVSACLALACWLLPVPQWPSQALLRLLPMALEAVTLLALAARGRALLRAYRAAGAHETRLLLRLRLAAAQELGMAGGLLVAELDMLRYALLGWWEPIPATRSGVAAFASHRESGLGALLGIVCFGLLIESAALHLLVRMWSPVAAGWLLVADAYALLLFIAHGHAVRLQPTLLTADELLVRVGFFWHVAVPRSSWPTAELLRGDFAADAEILNLARPLLTAPNVMLTFAAPISVTGPYGICRPARRLALYLDQPMALLDALAAPRH